MVSLTKLKAYLSITSSDDDTLLTSFEVIASARVSALVGKELNSTVYTSEVVNIERSNVDLQPWVKFDLSGMRSYIHLENYPVTTFTSLIVGEDTLTVDEDYYVLLEEGVLIMATSIDDSYKNALATYTAGYAEDEAPEELQWIVMEMVKSMYQDSTTPVQGSLDIKSEKIGEYAVSYDVGRMNTFVSSSEVQMIINKYKNVSL
jgi:hypothetical protein